MFRFMRGMIKWSVIGGLGLLGLVALVGVGRVKAAYVSVREHVRSNMDEMIDTRQALLTEMKKLQKEYPDRIAELRVQLREVDRAVGDNAKDTRLCREVVALCRSDREVLAAKLDANDRDADGISVPVIEFRSERLDRNDAVARASRILETERQYGDRLSDLTDETAVLRNEKAQIQAELEQTESEYRDFQMEYTALMREADSLERKEDLVDMAEARRGEREDIFSDRASSLQTLKDRMEKQKIKLDAKLQGLRTYRNGNEYETRARLRLRDRSADAD